MLEKNTEQPAKTGNALFHILETTPNGFISVDHQWTILYCSSSSMNFPATPGKNLWESFSRRKNFTLYSALQKAVVLQRAIRFESYYEPLKIWAEVVASPADGRLSIYFKDITTQKDQEGKGQPHHQNMDVILDLSSAIIWDYDLTTGKVHWQGNKLSKLLNHDADHLDPVEIWARHVHPDDMESVRTNTYNALQEGKTDYSNHYRLRKNNGEYIYVRDRARIIRDAEGNPTKVIGATEDVTTQKRYEDSMIEAKKSFKALFSYSPLPELIYDRQTLRFLDVNDATLKTYGYCREEILQMTLYDICSKAEHQRLTHCLGNNEPISGEWIHRKKNEEEIWVDISVTPVEYQNKNVYLATITDITERKKAELQLKESQQKLSAILESIGDGFLTVDRYWTITYLNGKAERLLGNEKAYFLGKDLWKVFEDAVSSPFYFEYHRAMKENIPVHFEEYYPGLNAWFEIHAYPSNEGLSIFFTNSTLKRQQEAELKENVKKLREAENDLLQVLESMTDGFYTLDKNWNIKYATDKVAAMLGINKIDYVGKSLWDCIPEAINTKFYTEYHRAVAEDKAVSFEEYLSTFDMWFEVNAYPHKHVLAVYVKDITQRKNDEKRLEFIARATSEVIWELDIHSKKAVINKENVYSVFGYQLPEDFNLYSFWLANVHPEDAPTVNEKNQLAIENNLDFHMNEYRLKKAEGSWAYVKDRVYLVRDEENKPVRMIGAMEDVTSERLTEKALQESEQTYKQLFDYAALPKAVYDRETLQFLNVNQAAIDHYGYTREAFLNMTILDIRPIEDHAKVKELVSKLNIHNRMNVGVWTHIKKGGERIQSEISMAAINYKGRLCNLVTAHDVTEKLKLQEQLTKEKIEKQQSITKATFKAQERERSEIGRELHDGVNQVLTTAKLYIENIQYFPEQKEAFIDKSVSLLQKSINEIRVLSKALVTPTITDIGFKEALLELIGCYRELNLFEINHEIHPGVEKIENEIKLSVYRIIQEQLNNIVKYAKASTVNIQLLLDNQELLILVEDNGVGFDLAQKKAGIGLSNIKNRAELFKGNVKITSAPDKGCKIEIVFPG